jgi:hypothetical protein
MRLRLIDSDAYWQSRAQAKRDQWAAETRSALHSKKGR